MKHTFKKPFKLITFQVQDLSDVGNKPFSKTMKISEDFNIVRGEKETIQKGDLTYARTTLKGDRGRFEVAQKDSINDPVSWFTCVLRKEKNND